MADFKSLLLIGVTGLLGMMNVGGWGCGPDGGEDPLQQTDVCAPDAAPADGLLTAVLGQDVGGAFQPLEPGEALTLHYGPQGGQHVYVSVKLFAPEDVTWVYRLALRGDAMAEAGSGSTSVDACAPGWTESKNITVYIHEAKSQSGVLSFDVMRDTSDTEPAFHLEVPVSIVDG